MTTKRIGRLVFEMDAENPYEDDEQYETVGWFRVKKEAAK